MEQILTYSLCSTFFYISYRDKRKIIISCTSIKLFEDIQNDSEEDLHLKA